MYLCFTAKTGYRFIEKWRGKSGQYKVARYLTGRQFCKGLTDSATENYRHTGNSRVRVKM